MMSFQEARQIKDYFETYVYGKLPPPPEKVWGETASCDSSFAAGKAPLQSITIHVRHQKRALSFPIKYCCPSTATPCKTVLLLNFRDLVPDKYLPAEEVIDRGWAFVSLCYRDVTADNGDFNDGLAAALKGEGGAAPGKIIMWAWAAMRVMDYLTTLPTVDTANIAVVGHSRLGKTALVTAAFDSRFTFCHSNDSGTGGAALFSMENEQSEHIADLVKNFPYWFCPRFRELIGKERALPYDQDRLLSLIAPRVLSVGSAEEDLWANPPAEKACAELAAAAWRTSAAAAAPAPVNYYVRPGKHYFSRDDWQQLLHFFDKHIR